jgi:hypothetical protein
MVYSFFFKNLLPAAVFRYNSRFRAFSKVSYSSVYTTLKLFIRLVVLVLPLLCSITLRFKLFVIPLYNLSSSPLKMYTVYITKKWKCSPPERLIRQSRSVGRVPIELQALLFRGRIILAYLPLCVKSTIILLYSY